MGTERAPVFPGMTFRRRARRDLRRHRGGGPARAGAPTPGRSKLSPGATWALYCLRAASMPVDARLRAVGEAHLPGVAARSSELHDGPIAVLEAIEDGVLRTVRSSYFAISRSVTACVSSSWGERTPASFGDLPWRRLATGPDELAARPRVLGVGYDLLRLEARGLPALGPRARRASRGALDAARRRARRDRTRLDGIGHLGSAGLMCSSVLGAILAAASSTPTTCRSRP